jgi:hypothetical protein
VIPGFVRSSAAAACSFDPSMSSISHRVERSRRRCSDTPDSGVGPPCGLPPRGD